jgi:hypothetical protein
MSVTAAERVVTPRRTRKWPNAWAFETDYEASETGVLQTFVVNASAGYTVDMPTYTICASAGDKLRGTMYSVEPAGSIEPLLGTYTLISAHDAYAAGTSVIVGEGGTSHASGPVGEHVTGWRYFYPGVICPPDAPSMMGTSFAVPIIFAASGATVALGPSALREEIVRNLDPLAGYEKYATANWDHYGAEPITSETLQSARTFLTLLPDTLGAPDIAPSSDGAIALEWSFNNRRLRKLFIDVGPGNVWSGYWRLDTDERSTVPVHPIDDDQTRLELRALFNRLNH